MVRLLAAVLLLLPAQDADTLRVSWGVPCELDPQRAASRVEAWIAAALFDGLPSLSEAEVSEDGRTWTFNLREAAWSNGDPLTAGDFVFSWRRALRPETGCELTELFRVFRNAGGWLDALEADALVAQYDDFSKADREAAAKRLAEIGRKRHAAALRRRGELEASRAAEARPELAEKDLGFEAVDARTVRVVLERRAPWLPGLLALPCFAPLHAKTLAAHGAGWVKPGRLVSNGAYAFAEATPLSLTLRRRAGEGPARVVVELLSEEVALEKFREGKLDWISREQIPAEKRAEQKDLVTWETWGSVFVRFNTARAPFDRVEVRRALARGIDRGPVASTRGKASARLVPPGFPSYPAVEGLSHDRAAAMEGLLKETGFDLSSFPRVEFLTTDAPEASAAGQALADQLEKDLGLSLRVRSMKWPAYVRALASGDFEVALGGWTGDYPDPLAFLEPWSKGRSSGGWSDAEFEALLGRADAARGPERLGFLAQAERRLLDAAAVVPLYTLQDSLLVSPRVRGLVPDALSRLSLRSLRLRE
jgi:oligopeptide transport system substrate-binding protein